MVYFGIHGLEKFVRMSILAENEQQQLIGIVVVDLP